MRKLAAALSLVFLGGEALASPAQAVASAAQDLATLPPEKRPYARYLSLYSVPAKEQTAYSKFVAVHINKLSRGNDLVAPVPVAGGLLRFDVRDYERQSALGADAGHFQRTYEKLRDTDPYFHAPLKVAKGLPVPKKLAGKVKAKDVVVSAAAPWLPTKEIAFLVKETQSEVPVLRADWFFKTTTIQAGREGVGYYDFLALKSRDDFFKLIGFSLKDSQAHGREMAAFLRRSGVAQNNRQIFRFGTADAPYWVTLDVFETSTKKRNAIRNLDSDFEADAQEHYGLLNNRLFAFYLSDINGVQQDSAPDKIGPDTTSTSNDSRIHVGLSCIRCHVEGIRPIDDYGRRLYRQPGPVVLQAVEYAKLQRLRQLYFSNLKRFERRDNTDYAETLKDFVGLSPKDVALAYRRNWKVANDDDVSPAQAALELGVSEAHLIASIKAVAKATGQVDPVVAGWLLAPPEGMLRDQFEEVYPLLSATVRGYVPP